MPSENRKAMAELDGGCQSPLKDFFFLIVCLSSISSIHLAYWETLNAHTCQVARYYKVQENNDIQEGTL